MNDIKVMNHAADNIRILAASMVEKANSGHDQSMLDLLDHKPGTQRRAR